MESYVGTSVSHTHRHTHGSAIFARKIWGESHFLDILHWTSDATKNEPAYEKKTHTFDDVSNKPSSTGNDKRASGDSLTLDNYDSQSSNFAQQSETGPFLIRIDHSVHDGYARNSPLGDLVICCDDESVVNNVISRLRQAVFLRLFHTCDDRRCLDSDNTAAVKRRFPLYSAKRASRNLLLSVQVDAKNSLTKAQTRTPSG